MTYNSWLTERVFTYSTYSDSSAFGIVFVVFALFYVLFFAAFYVLYSVFLSRVFRKAGIDEWKAWVPFYNNWVFFELGGQAGWLSLLVVIPLGSIVAAVFSVIAAFHIGSAFQKPDGGWVVLYLFLPYVWLGIIAFDSSRWEPQRMSVPPIYGGNVPRPSQPFVAT